MTARPAAEPVALTTPLGAGETAIARSVLYAALFDYPLTLAQLRQTLIGAALTPTQILTAMRESAGLRELVDCREGYFFPAGRSDLIAERRRREARSRAFLASHRTLLRVIGLLPYVRLVALSGSIAHLNLERGGDLDLFIVTRGAHVWSTAVAVVLLAKMIRRRRALCANFIVSDRALAFSQQDLFTASQIVGLRPLTGAATYRALIAANPFVGRFYPNFHVAACGRMAARRRAPDRVRSIVEWLFAVPAWAAERLCRGAYRRYLRAKSAAWESPDQVRLDDECLKLHTRSHRQEVLTRFDETVADLNSNLNSNLKSEF